MPSSKVITALDIGSSKIRAVVGVVEDKKSMINVIGVGTSPSAGMRKGVVSDLDEAVANITTALEEAERMSGEAIHRAFISFSGPSLETYDSKGVIAIGGANSEISEVDVDRVLDAARTVSLPANREILRIIPKSFTVDSQRHVRYPVGMSGIRLEVEAHIIAGQTAAVKNLEKCLYQAGVDIEDIVPSQLACAEAILDKRQKELGVILVEIGASSTNLAVFEEGTVIYSCILPIGGEHVTNDLAIGARAAIDTAEKIKIEYGSCLPQEINEREQIDLSQISKSDTHSVDKKHAASVIEARYQEIFLMIHDELIKIGRAGMLPAGAVLCGAAVKTPGIVDLARNTLGLPVQLGFPKEIEGIADRVDDPGFATAIGLLHFGNRYGANRSLLSFNFGNIGNSIVDFFRKLIP
ncbi:cell division protein FtsA [bacterium]|jgi:cell division protein FtsA|nr:cell division protein FtsA [bacterium]MBT6832117.1 cell division protein FtsA [bacterium]MBT6996691.1 cell division protein FtsA [bacterium]MBT7772331.1 cell division protein FtsA [bacterium]